MSESMLHYCGKCAGNFPACLGCDVCHGVGMVAPPASQESAGEAACPLCLIDGGNHSHDCPALEDATIATLTAELAEAREQRDSLREECATLRAQLAVMTADRDTYREAYGKKTIALQVSEFKLAALSASGRDADGDGRG